MLEIQKVCCFVKAVSALPWIFSNEKMQEIWGKILAGEANKPGNFSRKTLDIVEELDQNDASFFQNLMLFTFSQMI